MTKVKKTPSDPTLLKLLEVDAELTAQEAGLQAQLQQIQQKRQSLQTVIGMFASHQQVQTERTAAELASTFESKAFAQPQQGDIPEEPSEVAVEDQKEDLAPRRGRSSSAKQTRT